MKPTLVDVVLLVLGIGSGYFLGSTGALPGPRGERPEARELLELREPVEGTRVTLHKELGPADYEAFAFLSSTRRF